MVRRYKVDTRDGSLGIVEMLPGVDYSAIHSREYVHADDYDALEAEWMALSQDDGKVERALESAQARIRELEAELKTVLEAMDAMETMPTVMSPAVCRSMGKYWNGLADRIARDDSPKPGADDVH